MIWFNLVPFFSSSFKEGFAALKHNAITRIPEVKKLEVAEKTIEKKK